MNLLQYFKIQINKNYMHFFFKSLLFCLFQISIILVNILCGPIKL